MTESPWWPDDIFDLIFLPRFVEKIGSRAFADWTGTEAVVEQQLALLPIPGSDSYCRMSAADLLFAEHLCNEAPPALHRLRSVRDGIIRQSYVGELTLKIRHVLGGPLKDFQSIWWNIDRPHERFRSCIIDPEYPFGGRPTWMGNNDYWIFAPDEGIDQIVARLAASPNVTHSPNEPFTSVANVPVLHPGVARVESPESGRAGAAEQLTYAQIADRLGCSAEAARALVKRRRLPRTRGSDGKTLVAVNLQEATSARSPPGDRPVAVPVPSETPLPATQPADPAPGTSEPVAADEPVPVAPSVSAAVDKLAPAPSAPEVELEAPPPDKPAVADSAPRTSKRRGPKPGTIDRFGEDDRALFSEITNLKERKNLTAQEAAKKLAILVGLGDEAASTAACFAWPGDIAKRSNARRTPTNFLALPQTS
jgi:hypothetical protein